MPPSRKYIDRHALKELCHAQLSNDEISRTMRVSWDTLTRRYAEAIKAWRSQGPASVRRELFLTAMGTSKGKVPSMIFFLKNYGGMSDRHEHTGPGGGPIQHQSFDSFTDEQLAQLESLVETANVSADQGGAVKT